MRRHDDEVLIRATIPVAAGNAFVKSADWQGKMDQIMGDNKPETAYFTLDRGQRTLYLLVDVEHSHQLPTPAEPLWHTFQADVDFIPTMTQEDFGAAMPGIEAVIKKYA